MFKFSKLMATGMAAALFCGVFSPVDSWAKPERNELARQIESLPATQQAKAKVLMQELKTKNAPLRESIKIKRSEIDALMKSHDPDKMQLEALSRQLGELRGQQMANRIEMREKFQDAGLQLPGKKDKGKKPRDGGNFKFEQLTPEQQVIAKQILEDNRAASKPARDQLKSSLTQLNALVNGQNPDLGQIKALSTEIGSLRGKILGFRVDLRQNLEKAGLPADLFDKPQKAPMQNAPQTL